jgi:DNA-binding LacI/PurR family transcriptional regulator
MEKNRVTLRDIAVHVGVSHVTVSLALRNHHSIPVGRRDEIKKVALQLGYRPDPMLASLAVYRQSKRAPRIQHSLAWINHWDQPERLRGEHKEFDGYWWGAAKSGEQYGYRLEEIRWEAGCSATRFQQILMTRNVRGLLIPPHPSPPDWGKFDWSKFSVVRFGQSVPVPESHQVAADHFRGVVMALRVMTNYGYNRIGMVVCGDFDRRLGGNYIGGYYSAQRMMKIRNSIPPLMTDELNYVEKPLEARKKLHEWMGRYKPNAILTSVPQIPDLIRDLGYRIPEQVAVVGTSVYDVPVDAGINQNPEEIGRIAVETLVAQILVNDRGEPPAPCRILVDSRWQDGKSLPRLCD